MQQNEGTVDRILRLIIGIVFLVVAFLVLDAAAASGGGIALAVIGAVLLITAATGFCAGYKLFNYSTKK
jgi:membrane-bound ClpP family serine protease